MIKRDTTLIIKWKKRTGGYKKLTFLVDGCNHVLSDT